MKVVFVRAPGYGDDAEFDLDAIPRVGEHVDWDNRSHTVLSVVWCLNDPADGEPGLKPEVHVHLDARHAV